MPKKRTKGRPKKSIESRNHVQADTTPEVKHGKHLSRVAYTTPEKGPIFEDIMLLSQSEPCDVQWQSNSPITLTQAAQITKKNDSEDIADIVRRFADDESSEQINHCSDTPPLLAQFLHHSDSESDAPKTPFSQRKKRGRPSGIKSAIDAKELFLKLANVFSKHEEEGAPDVCDKELDKNTSESISATEQRCNATEEAESYSSPEKSFDLFEGTQKPEKEDIGLCATLKPTTSHKFTHLIKTASPVLATHVSVTTASNLTPVSSVTTVDSLSPLRGTRSVTAASSVPAVLNQSVEDLWTDEEMFDDSFIIKATQIEADVVMKKNNSNSKKRSASNTPSKLSQAAKIGKYSFCQSQSHSSESKALTATSHIGQPLIKSKTQKSSTTVTHTFKKPISSPNNVTNKAKVPAASYYNRNNALQRIAGNNRTMMKPTQASVSANIQEQRSVVAPSCNTNMSKNFPQKKAPFSKRPIVSGISSYRFKSSQIMQRNSLEQSDSEGGFQRDPKVIVKTSCVASSSPVRVSKAPVAASSPITELKGTSITDDLLASLAEPDEILESQAFPDDAVPEWEDEHNEEEDNILLVAEDHSFFQTKKASESIVQDAAEVLCPNAGTKTVIPPSKCLPPTTSMGKVDNTCEKDSFDSDDEMLNEDQMLAILEQAESQVTQTSSRSEPAGHVASQQKALLNRNTRSKSCDNTNETAQAFTTSAGTSGSQHRVAPGRPHTGSVIPGRPLSGRSGNIPSQYLPNSKSQSLDTTRMIPVQKTIAKSVIQSNEGAGTVGKACTVSSIEEGSSAQNCSQESWMTDKSYPRCSPDEIQRKKQEALKRRQQNRLKLSKKK